MKCGESSARIFTTFMTGLNGTPMPSYDGAIATDDAWDLVHYIQSLSRQAPTVASAPARKDDRSR